MGGLALHKTVPLSVIVGLVVPRGALRTIDGITSELADVRDGQPPTLSLLRARRHEIMRVAARRGLSKLGAARNL
jgi:hypothetical protein